MDALNKYERARIMGARALQISLGAPVLVEVPKNVTEPLEIARIELESDVMPIAIKRL